MLMSNERSGAHSILEERPEIEEMSPQNVRGASPKFFGKDDQQIRKIKKQDSEVKSAGLRPSRCLNKDHDQPVDTDKSEKKDDAFYPPPEDIYRSKVSKKHEYSVSYGLNMVFKKAHEFSGDPNQAGGDLAPNQTFSSMPWGVMGCPVNKQENITDYVRKNIKDVVFSRYGMEYLRSFPRCDDLAIGSYRINLDYLIFQKQRHLDTDNNASLVGMSFLKTKGQVEMNRQNQQIQNASPDKKASVAMGAGMIHPFYKILEPDDRQTLSFDSVFESGNLALALKVSDTEYNCLLQNDINTNGHTQWFYFKAKSNFEKKTAVKINLINLYKGKSLYQYGMRVLCLNATKKECPPDESPSKQPLPKWERSGSDVCYIQNRFTNEQCPNGLFQVQFTYEFEAGQQEIYFAHSMPFTYSMLNEYLNKKAIKGKAKRQTLCYSLAGNKVEYLIITNKTKKPEEPPETEGNITSRKQEKETASLSSKDPPLKRQKSLTKKNKVKPAEVKPPQKQVILLTSRVHPGETNASWMMQGLLDTLLTPKNEEEEELVNNLKDHFEFYIIPMLNVDGVINGNYRCSLASCDLNRKWQKPNKVLHPPVYHTKKLAQTIMETEKKQFFLYLDFHGHSAKKNIFQYGNRTEQWAPSKVRSHQLHAPSVFPLMVSKQFDYFNFQDCTYSMPKSKDSTARITMFHKLRIPFVFTLEASFAGANRGHLAGKHFSQGDFENVGRCVLKAMWEVKKLELNKNLLKQITEEATKGARASADDGDESDGCSSSEEDEQLPTTSKKAIAIIQEGDPSPKRVPEAQVAGTKELVNNNLAGPQGTAYRNRQGNAGTQPAIKGAKPAQNRSIISLKTIASGAEAVIGSKSNSPRKQPEGLLRNHADRFQREAAPSGSPVRRSVKPFSPPFNNLEGAGQVWRGDGQSDGMSLQNPSSQGGDQSHNHNDNQQHHQKQPENEMRFDLIKNLIRAENPDDTEQRSGLSSAESSPQQQELFEQFNAQIEQSFSEQQQHLDEIFRQTAKQFLEQRGNSGVASNQSSTSSNQNHQFAHVRSNNRGQQTQSRFSDPQGSPPGKSQNWFLEQFLQQQKQNYQRDKGPNSSSSKNQSQFGNDPQSSPFNQFSGSSQQHQTQQSHAQIQTFLQLQKLHQMQKLNQMAQMQFFRQQAELLLSQNLTQQQQWEVFQQFSYYQAQIQMQNQQYQMMLSQSLHGNNMQILKAQYASAAAAALSNQQVASSNASGSHVGGSGIRQIDDNSSNSSQQAFQHHHFNRQRRFASTTGSVFGGPQSNQANSQQQQPDQNQMRPIEYQSQQQHHTNSSILSGARAQSPLKQLASKQIDKHTRVESQDPAHAYGPPKRQIYSTQDEQINKSPSRQIEEFHEDYDPSNSSNNTSKKQPDRLTRNSAAILNSKSANLASRPNASSQIQGVKSNPSTHQNQNEMESEHKVVVSQPYQSLVPPIQVDNIEPGQANIQGKAASTSGANQVHQQAVLKLKKGLVDFKQGPVMQQAINFHGNYNKYATESNVSQFEPQNFSQMLNQHLVEQQYQHLQPQAPPQNSSSIPPVYQNKKFFSTRGGRFTKHLPNKSNNKYAHYNDMQNEHIQKMNQVSQQAALSQQNPVSGNVVLSKPSSQHFARPGPNSSYPNSTQQSLNSQFSAAPYYTNNTNASHNSAVAQSNSSNQYQRHNNIELLTEKHHQQRFASEVDKMDQFVQGRKNRGDHDSPDVRNMGNLIQSSYKKSHSINKAQHQQFASTEAKFRGNESSQHQPGSHQTTNRNQQNAIQSMGQQPNENSLLEVTIGKSKLIPVLQPGRQGYANQSDQQYNSNIVDRVQHQKQQNRGAPGTAGGPGKSGASTGFAQHMYNRSDHLAINKSQDENIMKKHYEQMGLGTGPTTQTPQQTQKFGSMMKQQDFQSEDNGAPKRRHQQPMDFSSFTAPISQNTRKAPSTFQHYPPGQGQSQNDKSQGQTISPQKSKFKQGQDFQFTQAPQVSSPPQMAPNKQNLLQIRTQRKQRISEKALQLGQSNGQGNQVNSSQGKLNDYHQQALPQEIENQCVDVYLKQQDHQKFDEFSNYQQYVHTQQPRNDTSNLTTFSQEGKQDLKVNQQLNNGFQSQPDSDGNFQSFPTINNTQSKGQSESKGNQLNKQRNIAGSTLLPSNSFMKAGDDQKKI